MCCLLLTLAYINVILVCLRENSSTTSFTFYDLDRGAWVVLTILLLNYADASRVLLT